MRIASRMESRPGAVKGAATGPRDPDGPPEDPGEHARKAVQPTSPQRISANQPASLCVLDGEDEARLVQEALEGDERAFAGLVQAYERVLFNVALRMVNDIEDARDVVQAAFVKAYRKLDTFRQGRKFFSWIYRITINEALDLLRRRRPTRPLSARWSSQASEPDQQYEEGEVRAIVHSALMELRTDHRQMIILRHLLQLSYHEMSGVLHVPEKTIKSRLFSARRALADVLKRRGIGPS